MPLLLPRLIGGAAVCLAAAQAHAFCGFYVGKADAGLFNEASQVILVRDGERTVISMLNDYKGDPSEFALVVPVPQVLRREQIHIGDKALFERVDAYSAPRLAEYYDPDPCARREMDLQERRRHGTDGAGDCGAARQARAQAWASPSRPPIRWANTTS